MHFITNEGILQRRREGRLVSEKQVIQGPQKLRRNVTKTYTGNHLPLKRGGGKVLVKIRSWWLLLFSFPLREVKQSAKQDKERVGRGKWEQRKGEGSMRLLYMWLWLQNWWTESHWKPDCMNLQSSKCEWFFCLLLVSWLSWEQAGQCHKEVGPDLWWLLNDSLKITLRVVCIPVALSLLCKMEGLIVDTFNTPWLGLASLY